jgi:Flp pilus assembly pilin Flp
MRVAKKQVQRIRPEHGAELLEYGIGIAIISLGFLTAFPSVDATLRSLDTDLSSRANSNSGYSYPTPLIPFANGPTGITFIHNSMTYVNPLSGIAEDPISQPPAGLVPNP